MNLGEREDISKKEGFKGKTLAQAKGESMAMKGAVARNMEKMKSREK